ncbi:CDP-glycerol glycerophosphotransferase family protein [Streptomyces sp. NPDC004111]|uniref:bifunctional glycosyltransferase/CDP-glycerol:glycerophosphate glycerophosphotransferase n=1 Tax=Streptomyces sp. NPDC004111 TaxID=3364690 RepID=UPI0036B47FCE
MPRFSIVVPAFRVQGYLRDCLDSVLSQVFTDFEVIAVNDCSPDACGPILDEYALLDPRVRPVHMPLNVGLGRARNAGMAVAQGDYLLFLDSDDTLGTGALAAIDERLRTTEDPEILIFDYERTYWWGAAHRNVLAELLEETGPEVFELRDRPELLDLLQVVWNKAYRRDFVETHGFQFPIGYYEDAPWTYCSLATAGSIAVLDRVCLQYRQRRQGGNILRTTSRRHFEVFDQYRRIFTYFDERPELDEWRPYLFRKMVDHYLTVLAKRDRLPEGTRREFFGRAAADYRERLPENFVLPDGTRALRYKALARKSYTALTAIDDSGSGRRRTRVGLRKARRKVGRRTLATYYRLQRGRPLDNDLAVYACYWNRLPACNPLAIYQKAKELAPNVHGVWVIKPQQAEQMPDGIDYVVLNSPRYWEVMARAKYFVNNVNFPDHYVKRPGQVHLQTHHGTPLKRMGIDQARYPAANKGTSIKKLLSRADRWDYSLSANQHSTEQWERVYPANFEHLNTGYPRNDIYYTATAKDIAAARTRLGIPPGKKALLYAPTMRDYQTGFVPHVDLERLSRELGNDFVVLVRTHYFYQQNSALQALQDNGTLIDVSAHSSVEELCLAADALITDYSSIMFDYANLDRPIIIYADDWHVYVETRGVTFDLLSGHLGDSPGALATTPDELISILREDCGDNQETARLRAAFRQRFCQFDDGNAAERAVRRLFLGQDRVPEIVPLPERIPAPAPQPPMEEERNRATAVG